MPLILSVGLARKIGQPGFSSLGASCSLELELDLGILNGDPAALRRKARVAFATCARVVDAELTRRARPLALRCAEKETPGPEPDHRCATRPQLRALRALAQRVGCDLEVLTAERFGATDPRSMTITQASQLITELQEPVEAALACP